MAKEYRYAKMTDPYAVEVRDIRDGWRFRISQPTEEDAISFVQSNYGLGNGDVRIVRTKPE